MSLLLFPVYKLSREITQPENICDIFFKKTKGGGGWDSEQNEWLSRSSRPNGSMALWFWGVMRNFLKFTRKHLCWSLFFNKVRRCRSATSLKMRLQRRYFPVNLAKFLRKPFLQNTTARLLLIIAILIIVKGELANKTVNYDT